MEFIMELLGKFALFCGLNDTPQTRGMMYLVILGMLITLIIVLFETFLRYNDANALEFKSKY